MLSSAFGRRELVEWTKGDPRKVLLALLPYACVAAIVARRSSSSSSNSNSSNSRSSRSSSSAGSKQGSGRLGAIKTDAGSGRIAIAQALPWETITKETWSRKVCVALIDCVSC